LAERALREAWPVPAEKRAALVAKLIEVALAAGTGDRERVSAIKALLAAGRLNLEVIRVAMAADYADVLEELDALQVDRAQAPSRKEEGTEGTEDPPPWS